MEPISVVISKESNCINEFKVDIADNSIDALINALQDAKQKTNCALTVLVDEEKSAEAARQLEENLEDGDDGESDAKKPKT